MASTILKAYLDALRMPNGRVVLFGRMISQAEESRIVDYAALMHADEPPVCSTSSALVGSDWIVNECDLATILCGFIPQGKTQCLQASKGDCSE